MGDHKTREMGSGETAVADGNWLTVALLCHPVSHLPAQAGATGGNRCRWVLGTETSPLHADGG